jgi:hypothetical protein
VRQVGSVGLSLRKLVAYDRPTFLNALGLADTRSAARDLDACCQRWRRNGDAGLISATSSDVLEASW